jgi:hypothetical protein
MTSVLLWPIIIQINEHVHTTIHVVTGVPVKISVNVQAASRGSEVQSGATKMGVGQKVGYTRNIFQKLRKAAGFQE